jgi:hypothetical protein
MIYNSVLGLLLVSSVLSASREPPQKCRMINLVCDYEKAMGTDVLCRYKGARSVFGIFNLGMTLVKPIDNIMVMSSRTKFQSFYSFCDQPFSGFYRKLQQKQRQPMEPRFLSPQQNKRVRFCQKQGESFAKNYQKIFAESPREFFPNMSL